MYTDTTVYTSASLETIAPFIHSGANHDRVAGDFPVPVTTECLGLAFQNLGVGQTSLFELYAKDVGPLMEPFDKDALLTNFELAILYDDLCLNCREALIHRRDRNNRLAPSCLLKDTFRISSYYRQPIQQDRGLTSRSGVFLKNVALCVPHFLKNMCIMAYHVVQS